MTQFGVQPRMAGSVFFPKPHAPPPPQFKIGAWVLGCVARQHGRTVEALTGRSHVASIVDARMHVAVIMTRDYGWSSPRVGNLLGGRDHTTILSLLNRARNMNVYDDIRLPELPPSRETSDRLASLSDAYRVASECYQIACQYGVTGDAEAALWAVVKREGDAAMAKRKV